MAKLGPEDETVVLQFLTKQSIAGGEEMGEILCNQISKVCFHCNKAVCLIHETNTALWS